MNERVNIDICELEENVGEKYMEWLNYFIENFPDIAFAHGYAAHLHKDQKYGDKPYMFHLMGVAANAIRISLEVLDPRDSRASNDMRAAIVAAFLHDSVEDGKVTPEDLGDELCDNLMEEDEAVLILQAVLILTKREHESYRNYITSLARRQSIIAKIVKLADLRFNKMQNLVEMANGKKHFKHMYEKYSFAEILVRQSLYSQEWI